MSIIAHAPAPTNAATAATAELHRLGGNLVALVAAYVAAGLDTVAIAAQLGITAQQAAAAIRQALACPVWCTLDHDTPDERHHAGEVAELRMRRHAAGRFHDSRPEPVALVALLTDPCCHPDGPVIELGLAWEQPEFNLTPGEARALAARLVAAADLAEQPAANGGAR